MSLDKEKLMKEAKQKDRRSFLKKSVYAAPTLIVMGALMKPTRTKAAFGGPPSDAAW